MQRVCHRTCGLLAWCAVRTLTHKFATPAGAHGTASCTAALKPVFPHAHTQMFTLIILFYLMMGTAVEKKTRARHSAEERRNAVHCYWMAKGALFEAGRPVMESEVVSKAADMYTKQFKTSMNHQEDPGYGDQDPGKVHVPPHSPDIHEVDEHIFNTVNHKLKFHLLPVWAAEHAHSPKPVE